MKTILVLCVVVAVALAKPQQTYDAKYDNFDAQDLVKNTRLLKAYGKCFLDQGPCTPEGADFKKTIPEALKDICAKCTPKQRDLVRVVVKGFQAKTPEIWEELVKKQDPEGKFTEEFNKFINGTD